MTPSRLRVHVDCAPSARAAVLYTLGVLLDLIGLRHVIVDQKDDADLRYGPDGPDSDVSAKSARILPSHPASSDAFAPGGLTPAVVGELLPDLLGPASSAERGDPVLLAYICLSGALERCFPLDPYGVPTFRSASGHFDHALSRPLVNDSAAALEQRLHAVFGARLCCLPRWPEQKRMAIAITHDVDEPYLHRRASYFRLRWHRAAAERRYRLAARTAAAWLVAGFAETLGLRPSPEDDPNFGFQDWTAFERSIGASSSIYVATTNSAVVGSSLEDVAYDATAPEFVSALRCAAHAGSEISLHASINSRLAAERIADERMALATLISAPVRGVRHHYWAIDCTSPEQTWRSHVAAGFDYDSSLGMNDRIGFRRGAAWPFRPFDPERGDEIDLVQVPPTLMDGAVASSAQSPDHARRLIEEHIDTVSDVGGLMVLDWHLEQSNPERLDGIGPLLQDILRDVAARSDVAWLKAADVADWWKQRRRMLSPETEVR